jgi:hypothetical protein
MLLQRILCYGNVSTILVSACFLLHVGLLFGLLFKPEDRDMFLSSNLKMLTACSSVTSVDYPPLYIFQVANFR